MSKITAAITAVGGYVPPDLITNQDLEKMVDTSNEWILTRTGIETRHVLRNAEFSDMGMAAVNQLLEKRGIKATDIDLLICCTVTGDMIFPASSNIICDKIGAKNAWGFDLSAACSGFIFGMETGAKMVESGKYKKVVVIGGDRMTSIIDYTDRNTCIIFGDGLGAVLLEPNEEGLGVIDSILHVDGSGRQFLHQKAGGSSNPPTRETVDARMHYVYQEGKTVFKFAVTNMAEVSHQIMERNNLTADDVAWLVPHQANKRIIDATAERMGIDSSKVMLNIQRFGNTTNGTLPLCLWEWESKLKKGDNIILSAFGGGFTWGAMYIKWAYGE
ncbi:MAG: ketoacyl-ACP synthase III [Flavobacteriaceae bacterium]|nr:ketoacyl-ACP synthase III [Flavobacteriaceae bacterium]